MSKEKVVLAYSGGLDTTAIIPWLKETFNYDVICCCIDCGQGEELDGKLKKLEERLDEKLEPVLTDLTTIKLSLENEIRPQIKLILENFVPAANRFEAAGDSIREMKADIDLLKMVVADHSIKLQGIS